MPDTRPLLLIGGGRMGTALLKGWVARGLTPVVVVEPVPSSELKRIAARARVRLARDLEAARRSGLRACVVALKPQVLKIEASNLRAIAQAGTTMISIAAGTTLKGLAVAWGKEARIVRAMPNTPGAIGRGISGLFASPAATAKDRKLAQSLLSALGATVWVSKESDLDSVTAVSASGPAYVFLLVEALAAAARKQGLPRDVSEQLARATITGAGALLDFDPSAPEVLRKAVTSPGGTTAAALEILMAPEGLPSLVARAVSAARKRARDLGR